MNLEELDAVPPAKLPFPVTRAHDAPIEAVASEPSKMPVMRGRFSTFDDPYEVNSYIEGHFMESIAPTAFERTVAESRNQMKVLYDHGQDPSIGNKVLGPIEDLGADARYTVPLFDTSYNRDLAPGLEAGVYGSSFRFQVISDTWNHEPARSKRNPEGIPERTITEARVYEFGPVTFPANPKATVGARSTTDDFYRRSRDPEQFEALLRSAQVARTPVNAGVAAQAEGSPESDAEVTRSPESDARRTSPPGPPAEATTQAHEPTEQVGSSDSRETTTVSEYISRDDKTARIAELRSSIARRAVEFDGELPQDVQAQDDAENREHDELTRAVAAWDARQARVRALSEQPENVEAPFTPPAVIRSKSAEEIHDLGRIRAETRSREEFLSKVRENALRSIDSAKVPARDADLSGLAQLVENRDAGEDGKGEIAERILVTGSPVYKRAFSKYLAGQTALWTQEEARAAALAVTATTTTGGYAVPYVFDPTLIRLGVWTQQNPFRAACRVETITNGNNWKAVTVGAVAAAYGTEGLAAVEGGPTFGQPSYQVQTASAFVTLSVETLQDRPDITGELTAVIAEGKDTLEENKFAVGAGTTVYPMGMFTATAYTAVNTATNDTTALADTQLVEAALPLRFRTNAAWFMNRSTLRQLLALDTGWRYFSGAGINYAGNQNPVRTETGNTGISLLGYPVWEVPSAVSTLTTDQALIAALVDPRSYIIVDRLGMNVEVIPHLLDGATPSFPTLQRGLIAYWRNTAKPVAADAGRVLRVQ